MGDSRAEQIESLTDLGAIDIEWWSPLDQLLLVMINIGCVERNY